MFFARNQLWIGQPYIFQQHRHVPLHQRKVCRIQKILLPHVDIEDRQDWLFLISTVHTHTLTETPRERGREGKIRSRERLLEHIETSTTHAPGTMHAHQMPHLSFGIGPYLRYAGLDHRPKHIHHFQSIGLRPHALNVLMSIQSTCVRSQLQDKIR